MQIETTGTRHQAQDVLIALRRIIRATDLQSRRIAKVYGLTIPQVMVLRSIGQLGDVTVKRLAQEVSLSQATVTTILNRLEQRGQVTRSRSQMDKRIVNARLTELGLATLEKVPSLLHEKFIERFEHLEAHDQELLVETLSNLAGMMDAETIDAAPLLDLSPAQDQIPNSALGHV